ncbi:hypothetical protein [Sporolactobacillus nakayamae]|uniref:Uncharacterized protein n=1 Tax=Sporolactobacillus nakayamae TaxID=269670 RepID=A0A1I2NBT2_9BACL|nr:hypothetical protein [Sporolactobacillus nakayamae]SFF99187.1 hypothetical protein SAMN02982927_00312 [Sporolactobacillus nakayamae]
MSFVSIIATNQWISAVSDGNLVEISTEGECHVCPGQKASFIQISKQQFIACTGSRSIRNKIKRNFPFSENPYVFDDDILAQLKQDVQTVPNQWQDVLLVIGEAVQQIECRMISNQANSDWVAIHPQSGKAGTLFMAGKGIDERKIKRIAEEFNRLIQTHGQDDWRNVIRAQNRLNQFVSTFDPTTGSRVFHLLIKK